MIRYIVLAEADYEGCWTPNGEDETTPLPTFATVEAAEEHAEKKLKLRRPGSRGHASYWSVIAIEVPDGPGLAMKVVGSGETSG